MTLKWVSGMHQAIQVSREKRKQAEMMYFIICSQDVDERVLVEFANSKING